LAAGNYMVSIEQYDNFLNGNTLAGGFRRDGQGNYTPALAGGGCNAFEDVSGVAAGHCRTNEWAFDVLNVNEANETTPEPASLALLGSGLLGIGGAVRRKLIAR